MAKKLTNSLLVQLAVCPPLAVGFLLSLGCSRQTTVSSTVTYEGKPVELVDGPGNRQTVQFLPVEDPIRADAVGNDRIVEVTAGKQTLDFELSKPAH